ncbi:ABC transporter permease [Cellulomonas sp. Root137]|uniref:ABC transporter permease n=1 Tax=Cellulomonas sp. Root137 TaxID=1736459 RepID=UPI0006F54127|nr:ABC transporter permease [Cellulomonas sp. Root137]KQY46750.1 ABC transporter [Cellulomonas sp. Root137]KRD43876.1 ABC transporter [Cellulomonas sp. Root930]
MTTLTEHRSPRAVPTSAAAVVRKPFPLVRHSLSLAKRSLIKTWRTPEALIDVTLQPAIFLVIFVYIFGGAVAGDTHAYLQFLLPGILAQTIATGAIAIGVNLNTDLEKGIFDRFKSLPIPRSAPLIGAVLGDVVRYVIVTVMTLGIGYLMGFRILTDPLSAVAGCLLAVVFALSLSWVSVFVGMKVRTSGAVQGIMFLIIMPLSFASNVFVPAGTLPSWMQTFVAWNPLTHLVAAMRGLFLGTPMGESVYWTLAWCVGLVAVFLPLAMRAYRRKV